MAQRVNQRPFAGDVLAGSPLDSKFGAPKRPDDVVRPQPKGKNALL